MMLSSPTTRASGLADSRSSTAVRGSRVWRTGSSPPPTARRMQSLLLSRCRMAPVVDTLIERGFSVHSINPKQVDRFRDRFTVAGAKDDSRDCDVMASALRTDRHCFRRLATRDPTLVELREWSRMHEEHGRDRRRYVSRLREQLIRYFPAFLQLEGELDADWKLELLERAPTPRS